VVSGLGVGGAEKALIARMGFLPNTFEQILLNIRPEIDALNLDSHVIEHKTRKQGINRLIEIYRFLHSNFFDVIIVRTPLDVIRFTILTGTFKVNKPKLIFEAHSNFATKKFGLDGILTLLVQLFSKQLSLTIAVSESVKSGPLCSRSRNVKVVYLGAMIDHGAFEPIAADTPKFLFVGRLVPLKRPIWLLERFLAVHSQFELPNSVLTIVGGGPLEREVKEFIKRHNLEKIVVFVGFKADVVPYYFSSTHLISCSTNEGLPITFYEAKLCGLSIISTPSGGGNEIFSVQDLEIESFSAADFENALLQVLRTPVPTLDFRKHIQFESEWMSAKNTAKKYYSAISDLFN